MLYYCIVFDYAYVPCSYGLARTWAFGCACKHGSTHACVYLRPWARACATAIKVPHSTFTQHSIVRQVKQQVIAQVIAW